MRIDCRVCGASLHTAGDWRLCESEVTLSWLPRASERSALGPGADVLSIDAEPHHHLAFKNEYVKVYQVEVGLMMR